MENHSEIELVKWIQAKNKGEDVSDTRGIYISSEDENDEQKLLEHVEKISQETSDNSDDSNETTSEDSEISHVVNKFEALSKDIPEINP